jgi:hypothetical protein
MMNKWFTISLVLLSALTYSCLISAYFYGQYLVAQSNYLNAISSLDEISYKVNMLVEYGSTKTWYNETIIPVGCSLLNATSKATGEIVDGEMSSFGFFVKSVKGVYATYPSSWLWFSWDKAERRWIQGSSGSDSYLMKQGDVVGWLLTDDWTALP